jgi:hypothetical protein
MNHRYPRRSTIDARPIVEANRAAAALRAKAGLVEAWSAELNQLPVSFQPMQTVGF